MRKMFWFVLGVLLYGLVEYHYTEISSVSGSSMEPTFHDGDSILITKNPLWKLFIGEGDVITFAVPGPTKLIKRVTSGSEGLINLPFIQNASILGSLTLGIPEDCVWVEGDNKENSFDSRSFGAVPRECIESLVLCRWRDFSWS